MLDNFKIEKIEENNGITFDNGVSLLPREYVTYYVTAKIGGKTVGFSYNVFKTTYYTTSQEDCLKIVKEQIEKQLKQNANTNAARTIPAQTNQ